MSLHPSSIPGGIGIFATNSSDGTDLTIAANNTYGVGGAIYADNRGSGHLEITSTGFAEAYDSTAIQARNSGSDLTITANAARGAFSGISAFQDGAGALTIHSESYATGDSSDGISAFGSYNSGDITVHANDTTGGSIGISATQLGTGNLTITSDGVASGDHAGIYVNNGDLAQNATITTNVTQGENYGIWASSVATGDLSITAQGDTIGSDGVGVVAVQFSDGGNLTINTTNVSGGQYGIVAGQYGSGALSITSTGLVNSENSNAIAAYNFGSGTDLTIHANDVISDIDPIRALHFGSGDLKIVTTGIVQSRVGGGISALSAMDNTNVIIDANNVIDSGSSAIFVDHQGENGNTEISATGSVVSGFGPAIVTNEKLGSKVTISLQSGASVSGFGNAIFDTEGDATVNINEGSAVYGNIHLGNGSDSVVLAGGDVSNVELFDGGDDASIADGFIDVFRFENMNTSFDFDKLSNFEAVRVDGGKVTALNTTLNVGDGTNGSGLIIRNGGKFVTQPSMTIDGRVVVRSDSTFATSGSSTVNGKLVNEGIVSMANGSTGAVLTVNGDFKGGGVVALDAELNASEASDRLVINGDVSGATSLAVNPLNATGAETGTGDTDGILLVNINGNSAGGAFVLSGGSLEAGAFVYDLHESSGNDVYLQSMSVNGPDVDPAGVYVSDAGLMAGAMMQSMNSMHTALLNTNPLRGRVAAGSFGVRELGTDTGNSRAWARVLGAWSESAGTVSAGTQLQGLRLESDELCPNLGDG